MPAICPVAESREPFLARLVLETRSYQLQAASWSHAGLGLGSGEPWELSRAQLCWQTQEVAQGPAPGGMRGLEAAVAVTENHMRNKSVCGGPW